MHALRTVGAVSIFFGFLGISSLPPSRAEAETCVASGPHDWPAIGSGGFACNESGDDRFVLDSSDDVVTVSGEVVLTSGSINCSAGALVIEPGARLTWSGPDDGAQEVLIEDACVFVMEGRVLWEGRLESVGWGSGGTPLETRLGLPESVSEAVQSGHYVHFAWDDFEPIGQEIRRAIQTEPGPRRLGAFHPSYAVGQFWRISAVGAGGQNYVDAFHSTEQDLDLLDGVLDGTPAFNPPGIAGPAESSYVGTRALVRGIVPTQSAPAKHGMYTRLAVPASVGVVDTDFGSRYVTWEQGPCAGERWKVIGFEDENAGHDVVMVAGDAVACGLNPFALTWGAGPGDLVRIVERPVIDGNDVAHVRVRGGTLRWRYPRLVRLDKLDAADETPTIEARCALCFYQESATSQIAAGSVIDYLELAYTRDVTAGTFLVSLNSGRHALGSDGGEWTRRFDELLDFCGVSTRGWWIHDEHNKTPVGDGTHGMRLQAGCADFAGIRVERVSDDALFVYTSHLGAAERPRIVLRLPILYENMGEGNSTQECLTLQTGYYGDGDDHSIVTPGIEIRDPVTVGCEIAWISNGVGQTFERGVLGGVVLEDVSGGFGAHLALNYVGYGAGPSEHCAAPGLPSACCTGPGTGSCAWPERAVERFPNVLSNSIVFPLGPDARPKLVQRFGGEIRDSVIAVSNASNHVLRQLYGATRSFISLRGADANEMRAFGVIWTVAGNETLTDANSLDYGPDLVVVNEYTGATDLFCATDYDDIALDRLVIERFLYLGNAAQPAGWLESCAATSGLGVEADGWLISTPGDGGKGLGQGALTDDGATIEAACIETDPAVAPESTDGFGPNVTPLSFHRSPFGPDADDDLPLRAYALWDEAETGCRGPVHVGVGRLGAGHVLGLGDGALRQLDRFATRPLPRTLAGKLDQVHDLAADLAVPIHKDFARAQVVESALVGLLSHVEVAVARAPSTSAPLTLEILAAPAGLPSGTPVASVEVAAAEVSTAIDFVTADLSSFRVRAEAGEPFAIVLRSEAPEVEGYVWGGIARGRYGAGASFRRAGAGAWEPDPTTAGADLDFRTFVSARACGLGAESALLLPILLASKALRAARRRRVGSIARTT